MPRDIQPVEVDAKGEETHPAFGMVRASRVSSTPGATLFDSEIQHGHYVSVQIETASRKRDLNRDWIHGDRQVIEIAMSEAQWASFVSSMNTSGVPCTLTYRQGEGMLPGMPYEPRLAQSLAETREAGDRIFEKAKEALSACMEKPTKANLRHLEAVLNNAGSNVEFAGKSLMEHVENTVTKARADIEAMVTQHSEKLGLEPGSYTAPLALGSSEDEPS